MRKTTVAAGLGGMRTDKYLQGIYPSLGFGLLQKTFRKKDVKVNGMRVKQDHILDTGDTVEIYLTDELLGLETSETSNSMHDEQPPGILLSAGLRKPPFSVVYEDRNIIIVDKIQGISVHADREENSMTLLDALEEYLGFKPMLCHRLDRNTGGLVMIAKDRESLDIIIESMDRGGIRKYYQCLASGEFSPAAAVLRSWLFKDENKSRVYISDEKVRGSLEIITKYRVLEYDREADISRLEIELLTGRTHQIRAHLAHIGHPVIGDGKYGQNSVNRPLKMKQQALWAYKLDFILKDIDAGKLGYLKGRSFEVTPGFPSIEELKLRLG
jgi:23S rRNA pseudouridine955/2504/2580 synthase